MVEPSEANPSVEKLAAGRDPVEAILSHCRSVVLSAVEKGWNGPPFDPFALAEMLRIETVPRDDIEDARTILSGGRKFTIEFNPNRPRARTRFSVAHEIVHTFFPDCAESIRNRARKSQVPADEWHLEMLCNIGAAELLMPIGSFPELRDAVLNIDTLLQLRKEYDMSVEAVLLRATRLTEQACLMFAASRIEGERSQNTYKTDYAIPSSTWSGPVPHRFAFSDRSVIAECIAIGFTAKGDENLPAVGDVHVECVGVPPYPGRLFPRVVGLAVPYAIQHASRRRIEILRGDATHPRGDGLRIVAQVVNNKTPNWGGGFALVVRKNWPQVQRDFQEWVGGGSGRLRLGSVRFVLVDESLGFLSMVCQHGYGPSPLPRIRYNALGACLVSVAEIAREKQASVHMPRIGCGQAGGDWSIVSELIEEKVCRQGVPVTVYDLPE